MILLHLDSSGAQGTLPSHPRHLLFLSFSSSLLLLILSHHRMDRKRKRDSPPLAVLYSTLSFRAANTYLFLHFICLPALTSIGQWYLHWYLHSCCTNIVTTYLYLSLPSLLLSPSLTFSCLAWSPSNILAYVPPKPTAIFEGNISVQQSLKRPRTTESSDRTPNDQSGSKLYVENLFVTV